MQETTSPAAECRHCGKPVRRNSQGIWGARKRNDPHPWYCDASPADGKRHEPAVTATDLCRTARCGECRCDRTQCACRCHLTDAERQTEAWEYGKRAYDGDFRADALFLIESGAGDLGWKAA